MVNVVVQHARNIVAHLNKSVVVMDVVLKQVPVALLSTLVVQVALVVAQMDVVELMEKLSLENSFQPLKISSINFESRNKTIYTKTQTSSILDISL